MASRTLAGLSAVLSAARSLPEALSALAQELAEVDRAAQLAVFEYDQQRAVLCRRTSIVDGIPKASELGVSLDHFPGPIRKALLLSKQFSDLGAQSDDYMKLLGFPAAQESGAFLLRGCTLDGELAGIVALQEPKRVFGARVSERISPAVDLFALAFERVSEREARIEATTRLEQLTRQLHEEHSRIIADLERKLALARAAASGDETESEKRIAELEAAAEKARVDARATAQRLGAVEEQVESAVGRLEKAHRQLYEQNEAITQQRNLLYRVERMLRDSSAGDSHKLVEDLLAVVSSTPSAEAQ
ncbi:MAG: hypothetical protein H0W63_05110 [Gemmatimonadaceae bacterium]|nr:hypothetical protein [Gemmatimonadaceae bacterium]